MIKKVLISFFSLITLFSCFLFLPTDTNLYAATNVIVSNGSTRIDASYGFSPRYINGVTGYHPFGITDHPEDHFSSSGDSWGSGVILRVQDGGKGTSGVLYSNVGTYQGNIIDLKLTVLDWGISRPAGTYNGKTNYPRIHFPTDKICAQPLSNSIRNIRYKMELLYHNTNTPVTGVKWHANFQDMDGGRQTTYGEAILPISGFDTIYLSSDTRLSQQGNYITNTSGAGTENSDKFGWSTVTSSSSSLVFEYEDKYDSSANDYSKPINSGSFYWWIFNGDAVVPFTTPTISKTVNGTTSVTVKNNSEISYDLNFSIPGASYKYSYLSVTDGIPLCYNITDFSVFDDIGNNVTSSWNISNNNNTMTFSLKSPDSGSNYNKSYKINIKVKKKDNYDMSAYSGSGETIINNSASISTEYGTNYSNNTTVRIYSEIGTSVANGTITAKDSNIGGWSNKTIYYNPVNSDYVLNTIKVDGNAVDISKYPNSYTFYNVTDDHNIDVTYRRVYKITTDCNNGGTIDTDINKIESGTSKTINFKPNDNYYIDKIIVDGSEISFNPNDRNYTFNNINADHHIEVVFKPYMTAVIEKQLFDTNGVRLNTLEDFKNNGINNDKINFTLLIKDNTENKSYVYTYNNKEPFKISYLKVNHNYTVMENKNHSKFTFDTMDGIDTSFINGIKNANNKITFTISNDSNTPQTYKIISKSYLTDNLIVEDDSNINLFKISKG